MNQAHLLGRHQIQNCANLKCGIFLEEIQQKQHKQTGMDVIERLRFLAPGTGEREGGKKTQPFNCFPSHRVRVNDVQNMNDLT